MTRQTITGGGRYVPQVLCSSARLIASGTLLALLALASTSLAQLQSPLQSSSRDFEHLPLLYEGPDPTANYFVPSARVRANPPTFAGDRPTAKPMFEEAFPPADLLPPGEPFIPAWDLADADSDCGKISEHKDGFFQKLSLSGAWLDRGKASGLGITEIDLSSTFAVPMPTREWPLLLSPTFNLRYLEGPRTPDLPPQLYEAFLDLIWLPRLGPRWMGILSVAPGLYGDFEVEESEAWRLTGRGMAQFDIFPEQLQILFGVLYLNRQDVRLLPAGGLIWTPSDDRRYELVFPRPKLAHRIDCGTAYEDWLYLACEFGGNSYAVDRGGLADFLTLRDYRVFLGLERKLNGGAGYRIEIGYVFSRRIEFSSGDVEIDVPNTALLRAGASF